MHISAVNHNESHFSPIYEAEHFAAATLGDKTSRIYSLQLIIQLKAQHKVLQTQAEPENRANAAHRRPVRAAVAARSNQ